MALRKEFAESREDLADQTAAGELLSDDSEIDEVEFIVVPERRCDPVIVPSYSIPVVNAASGSVKVALGLVERHSNYPMIVSISGVNFFVSLGMNLRYTMDGIKGTVSYLRHRTTPSSWAQISNGKNAVALTLALTTALTKSGTDSILNHYFIMRLPVKFEFKNNINMGGWEAFSWTMSAFTFVGSLSSGGMAMYVKLRNLFGGVRSKYSNRVSCYISPPLGTTASLAYAITSYSGAIVSVSKTFGLTSPPALAGVCVLGMVNAVNTQFTNIPYNVSAVDKFMGCFTAEEGKKPGYKDPYQVVSFTFALAAGSLIAYSSQPLSKMLMHHSLEVLGVNCTEVAEPVIEVIAGAGVFSNLVWVGAALTPLVYSASRSIVNAMSACWDRATTDDVTEVEPLLVDAEGDFEVVVDGDQAGQSQPQVGSVFRLFSQSSHARVVPQDEKVTTNRYDTK